MFTTTFWCCQGINVTGVADFATQYQENVTQIPQSIAVFAMNTWWKMLYFVPNSSKLHFCAMQILKVNCSLQGIDMASIVTETALI